MDLSFERAIQFAADLIRIPGPSGGEGDVAKRVREELERLGFPEIRIDRLGNVIGRIPGRGSGPSVMLSSHLDVVDVGDASSWERPPYGGDIADGYLHGRGAMDIKGPLAIQTYAAAHFLEEPPRGDVIVAHTVFEERGGWGMQALLESGGVRPDAVIIGESTDGDVCIGHRGRAELLVEVGGRAGHASAPGRAVNPLYAVGAVLAAVEALAADLPEDPLLGPSTLAPTEMVTRPASRNVIPDQAIIALDWRVLPGWTAERAVAHLDDFLRDNVRLPDGATLQVRPAMELQRSYTGVEDERLLFSPGFLLQPDHPLPTIAAAAVARATGRRPTVRPWTFATDGGHTCGRHGIPTVGFAPGQEHFAHTNRERLELDQARTAYRAYPELIRAIQQELS